MLTHVLVEALQVVLLIEHWSIGMHGNEEVSKGVQNPEGQIHLGETEQLKVISESAHDMELEQSTVVIIAVVPVVGVAVVVLIVALTEVMSGAVVFVPCTAVLVAVFELIVRVTVGVVLRLGAAEVKIVVSPTELVTMLCETVLVYGVTPLLIVAAPTVKVAILELDGSEAVLSTVSLTVIPPIIVLLILVGIKPVVVIKVTDSVLIGAKVVNVTSLEADAEILVGAVLVLGAVELTVVASAVLVVIVLPCAILLLDSAVMVLIVAPKEFIIVLLVISELVL